MSPMANATWRIAGMFAGACWWSPGLTVILCTCCRRLEASRRHVGREAERPARRTPRDTLEQLGAVLLALLEHTRTPVNRDTIVLIHGFWVTPRSWEQWKAHYEKQGYRVLTSGYPGVEVEVEALNADPNPDREPDHARRHRPPHRGDRKARAS
jgi:hypothetical protein